MSIADWLITALLLVLMLIIALPARVRVAKPVVLHVSGTDIVVFECDGHLSRNQVESIRAEWQRHFSGGPRVVVLDGGMKMAGVMRIGDAGKPRAPE